MAREVEPGLLSPCRHPYSFCMLSAYTYKCLKQNAAMVNFCLGANGWNILSAWPRNLHVDNIIKTSFSGKNSLVLKRAFSVRHRTQSASPISYHASRLTEPTNSYWTRSEWLDFGYADFNRGGDCEYGSAVRTLYCVHKVNTLMET